MELHQNGADQSQASGFIGENAHHPSATLDFATETLQAIGGPQPAAVRSWEGEHRQALWDVLFQPICQSRNRLGILLDGYGQVGFRRVAVRGVEDGPQVFRHFAAHFLSGHVGASVLLQMELTALPGYSAEDGHPSGFQPSVVIADDELHTVQATCYQALQEASPVNFMLA